MCYKELHSKKWKVERIGSARNANVLNLVIFLKVDIILINDKLKIYELYVKEIQFLASSNKTKL